MKRKKTYLFGIPIDRKVKVRILICTGIAVFFLLMYIILSFFYVPPTEEVAVVMPSSGLSQSVFDTQNMTYTSVEGYTEKHSFKNVPFTIDTVPSQSAKIGEGEIYSSGEYYFYYSDMEKDADISSTLINELTDVLLLGGDKNRTTVSMVSKENGYINGCEGVFYILNIVACRDKSVVNGSLCVYELDVNSQIYDGERKLLVGCLTIGDVMANTYENICTLAYSDIMTLQYSKEVEQMLENGAKEDAVEENGTEEIVQDGQSEGESQEGQTEGGSQEENVVEDEQQGE